MLCSYVGGVCSWLICCYVVCVVVCLGGIVLLMFLCICWFGDVSVVLFSKVPDKGSVLVFGPSFVW